MSGFIVEGIEVQKDEAMVVYHAGPNKFGQFSMTVFNWEYDDAMIHSQFLLTSKDMESVLKKRGLRVRKIDERSSAMR